MPSRTPLPISKRVAAPLRTVVALVVLAALLLGGAATAQNAMDDAPEPFANRVDLLRPDAPELAARGEVDIGVRTLELTDSDRLDIVNATAGEEIPRYDRTLTVELWHPATLEGDAPAFGEYATTTRDPSTAITLYGRAVRGAEADRSGAPYPLVIISHGYPGNRFLLSHLAENLASKGYVVASIDHTDSTYADQAAFGSTLLNRPLDQAFVLDELERLAAADESGEGGPLAGLIDTSRTGLVGYSMGAYGGLNLLGAGFTEAAVQLPFAPPNGALAERAMGNEAYDGGSDPRIRAAILVAPWGMNAGFWDAEGLAGLETPTLFVAGSKDDVAGYENGVEAIYQGAVNADRWLLTFVNARHNAAAPIPAPVESWQNGTYDHYSDPVWDTVKMNNVFQHFATAFFGLHVLGDDDLAPYLDLVENANDGVWSLDDDGNPTDDHSHWLGFPNRSALGMTLRHQDAQSE